MNYRSGEMEVPPVWRAARLQSLLRQDHKTKQTVNRKVFSKSLTCFSASSCAIPYFFWTMPTSTPLPDLSPPIEYGLRIACARSRERANSTFEAVPGRSARPFTVTPWPYDPPHTMASWMSTSVTTVLLPSTSTSHNDLKKPVTHVSGPYTTGEGVAC